MFTRWLSGTLLILLLNVSPLYGSETINWVYFPFAPLYIVKDNGQVDGYGAAIQNMLWDRLPQYRHIRKKVTGNRMLKGLQHGKPYCFVGLLKTPEREVFCEYSLPCRLLLPSLIGVRREDAGKFSSDGMVSIQKTAQNNSLVFGAIKAESHSPQVDKILRSDFKEGVNLVYIFESDETSSKIKMLLAGRIDYAIFEPEEAKTLEKETGISDKVVFLPLKEAGAYMAAYAACPKNEWGRQVIGDINGVLRRIVPTREFFEIYAPYVPKSMMPGVKHHFDNLIVKPALEPISSAEP